MEYLTEKEITISNEKVINLAGFGMIQVLDPARLNNTTTSFLWMRSLLSYNLVKSSLLSYKKLLKHVFADGNR